MFHSLILSGKNILLISQEDGILYCFGLSPVEHYNNDIVSINNDFIVKSQIFTQIQHILAFPDFNIIITSMNINSKVR